MPVKTKQGLKPLTIYELQLKYRRIAGAGDDDGDAFYEWNDDATLRLAVDGDAEDAIVAAKAHILQKFMMTLDDLQAFDIFCRDKKASPSTATKEQKAAFKTFAVGRTPLVKDIRVSSVQALTTELL